MAMPVAQLLAAGVVTPCTEASLRAALIGGGIVTFDCDGTIILTNTIAIDQDSFLDGSGHAVVISGDNRVRIFQVNTGVTFTAKALTIANGSNRGSAGSQGTPGGDGFGAGILNLGGTVNLSSCTLTNHLAQGGNGAPVQFSHGGDGRGAALCNLRGQLHLTNCFLANNSVIGGNPASLFFGTAIAGGAYGAALYTDGGIVMIEGCTFAANGAIGGDTGDNLAGPAYGGALYATSSVLRLNATLVLTNVAQGGTATGMSHVVGGSAGGGGVACALGTAEISNSAFRGNSARGGDRGYFAGGSGGDASGGAVDGSGSLEIVNSRFSSNLVVGGVGPGAGRAFGGAIGARGQFSISSSTLDGNEARGGQGSLDGSGSASQPGTNGCGGAIFSAADLRATNITLTVNRAVGGNSGPRLRPPIGLAGAGQGGAICISTGTAVVVHATVFGNTVQSGIYVQANRGPVQGGGIAVLAGSATFLNSILATNLSGSNCFGAIIDGGSNISSDSSCPFTNSGSRVNTDARLGPFGDYGGPTPSIPLLAGSPAIDAAAASACAPIDQRGIARPYGAGCDIGAFESAPPYTIRGHITGYLSSNGTTVFVAMTSTNADLTGSFAFNGLSPGSYTLTPSAQDAVFVSSNQVLNVGPDIVDADFHSYRSNSWTVVGLSNNLLHLVLAGATGRTYQVFDSTNLTQWSLLTNSVIPSSGLFPLEQPADQRRRFFRSLGP